jgi:hypothetical protein
MRPSDRGCGSYWGFMTSPKQILCPSSTCQEGAVLVGVVLSDRLVAYADKRVTVGPEFVAAAREETFPERRFRFAGPCLETGCRQWSAGRCGVIDEVMAANRAAELPDELPGCSIRSQCRWFFQSGKNACRVCCYVVTDPSPAPVSP